MWFFPWLRNSKRCDPAARRRLNASSSKRAAYRPRIDALEDRYLPSTLTVLNAADSGPGSLRAEIAAAQSGDTITFDPSLNGQTITLTSGELVLNKGLDIEGPGAGLLAVSGKFASRVFDVTTQSPGVTIAGLTVEYGSAKNGGGIENRGTLAVNRCSLPGSSASADGGAIENRGTMTITSSTFDENPAYGDGGAIANWGTATITASTFRGNYASRFGGDIDNKGTMIVTSSSFLPSLFGIPTVAIYGGAIANSGTMTVRGSTFVDCDALNAGGTIWNQGTMTLAGSSINDFNANLASSGGGIWNDGILLVTQSTIVGAQAGQGAGITNWGTLTLSASMVTDNVVGLGSPSLVGGGIANFGTLYITNGSIVCDNVAQVGADLYNAGTVTISSDSTVGVIGP